MSEEPGSDICSFSTVEDSSRGKRSSVDEFRILDDDDDLEIVERAVAMLLLYWPEMEAAAIATSREVLMVVIYVLRVDSSATDIFSLVVD